MEVTLSELNNVFNNAFGSETEINENTTRDDVGTWDSINHLNLIVELEDRYHTSFTTDEITGMASVKNIIEVLKKK